MFEYFNDDPDLENVLVDSTVVRAHACAAGAPVDETQADVDQALGRSRGGFSTNLHVKVDALGNPIHLHVTARQRADVSHKLKSEYLKHNSQLN